ncbi:N-lysine methyltransferase KMT5A-like [Copidosoma floridanum]|uniref:N-lysine methyltransferase KMT5A-like n=1 Tax=Copidosoma floridanum TaxID=29053 RepID=UPI000C6F6A85|nr:N-lysine methyltransferase KMT5A-like [Copidosoma floridanum]
MLVKQDPESTVSTAPLFICSSSSSATSSSTLHRIKMPSAQEQENEPQLNNNGHLHKQQQQQQQKQQQVKRKFAAGKLRVGTAVINNKITEYFQVRRSERKCKRAVLEEKQRDLENKVRCSSEDGLQVRCFNGKGRGVITTRSFVRGEFVVEYIGELIDLVTAKKREAKYAKDLNTGCYMYYFQHRNQQYCIDATAESDKLGRLVNHSRNGNLLTRIVEIGDTPHLVLIAKEDIPAGKEITYDYGDRSRESIQNYPCLIKLLICDFYDIFVTANELTHK